jgi:hypothetical protein
MFVNDEINYSDFTVSIQYGTDQENEEQLLRDGYPEAVQIDPGLDMGWRTATFDLSGYKGQHIWLVFSIRNIHAGSKGIWTFVDDVRAVEAVDLPPENSIFLPFIKR